MGRSDAAIRRCWQEWVDSGRFQRHDGSGRAKTTADREGILIFRSAVTALDLSLSTLRHAARTRVSTLTVHRRLIEHSLRYQTPLVVIRGTLTTQRYIDDILRTDFLPFLWQYPGLIFQQNNAPLHTARVAVNCLTACQTLPWIARSPDPSAIEPVWDVMGRRMHLPGNVDDLARQLEQIWQEIPQETIRGPYYSMARHVAACM
ncbi:transposable element Tc1 transposase [Trichonephila clavipes]|nr:transposable element Tc1 transposase [Trichonephila clavipes]